MAEMKDEEYISDDEEENEMPYFKYFRLTKDVSDILAKRPASCLAVHPKFLCIGTTWGSLHLVDHQGNIVRNSRPLRNHSVPVNCLDINERGDFIVSCSDDGAVRVCGLYKDDGDDEILTGRLVKTVAIDPSYGKAGAKRRFIVGHEHLTLHEKSILPMWKSTVLGDAEGFVQNISWYNQFVAWATELGVRVYDLNNKCSLGLLKWPTNKEALPRHFRCNLAWCHESTLLIGWVDTIRVCLIRRRGPGDANGQQLPEFLVEPRYTFKTDFYISGICPQIGPTPKDIKLIILGFSKETEEDGSAKRPTLQSVLPTINDYSEVATPDELQFREYKKCKVNDFHLVQVPEENRYFVVSPKDIVVATVTDANDKVEWFLKNGMYEEALQGVKDADRYSIQQVGTVYIDYLFSKGEYEKMGKLCASIFGKDKKLWEEKVYNLARIQQLKTISEYLPIDDFRLDKQVYEMVLYEFLKSDQSKFLELIKKWSPSLYHVPTVKNIVIEHIVTSGPDNVDLLEALALLYSHDKKYDRALAMYLKLKNKNIFSMIRHKKLYSAVLHMVLELMQLDADQAVTLFLDEREHFPVETVVTNIQTNKALLFQYLDNLDRKDTKLARKYHDQLVFLYAEYDKEGLPKFLRRSTHYPIHDALVICQDRKLYSEVVYLLNRMGRSKEALNIMIEDLKDINQAIEFCKEQDDLELWEDLIGKSLNKPEFITYLLNNIGTAVDPAILVKRIAPNLQIPGLKNSLAKMMKDYGLQVAVKEAYKTILVSDNFDLQNRLISIQSRGYRVDDDQTCTDCKQKIQRTNSTPSIVVYFCKHVFHGDCSKGREQCQVCHSVSIK